jgi:hypothetical protein
VSTAEWTEEQLAARRAVAAVARDAEECRDLLEMLGLVTPPTGLYRADSGSFAGLAPAAGFKEGMW